MKQKILIADDSVVNVTIMYDILKDAGYDVLSAQNGKTAVEQALAHLPDLILMDWQMPVMSGIDALELLKTELLTREIPVIMVTGIATTAEHLEEAFEKGAIDFIKKPFEKIELLARVKAILSFVTYYKLAVHRKNSELSASMLQLTRLTGLHNQIAKKLAKLKEDLPETGKQVNDMLSDVTVQLLDEAWNRYEEYLRELSPGFLQQLLQAHPDISPAEIRLCSLLRLNMSSKEIAAFVHQEEAGVRVSRSRLRKKLALPETDNLVAYLMQF